MSRARSGLVLLVVVEVLVSGSVAQLAGQASGTRRNAVFVEGAGSALYYSVNLERDLTDGILRPFARLGGMYVPGTFTSTWGVLAGGGLHVGDRPAFEIGAVRVFGDADDEDIPPGWSFVGALRLSSRRLVVRAGATWLVSDRTTLGDREKRLWPLASVGVRF